MITKSQYAAYRLDQHPDQRQLALKKMHDDSEANRQLQVYHALRQALLDGELQPGQRLKIRDLAEHYAASTMPVRAALQRLVAEGALRSAPQRSVQVPVLRGEEYQQLLSVRLALEPMAAAQALPRLTPDERAALGALVQRMARALSQQDAADYLRGNADFHPRLYRACGNPVLMRLIEGLWLQVGPVFTQLFNDQRLHAGLNTAHEAAWAALQADDSQALARAIHDDLADCGELLAHLLP